MSDKELVKTVTLSNRDRFYFSRKYDEKIIDPLISKSKNLYFSIKDIPILPSQTAQIEEDIIIKSIHGTAAIEGNPLSEEDVADILTKDDKVEGDTRAKKEIRNLKTLYKYIKEADGYIDPVEKLISIFHETVLLEINGKENRPGKYRAETVKVGDASHGGTYKPPSRAKDIRTLMREYIIFLNSQEVVSLDPIIRGAIAHYHLGLIHPFLDGNGRTARFLEAYIIRSADIKYVPALLSNYYYRNMDDYYWAFSLSEKNKPKDITPFIEFVYKGVVDSLTQTKVIIYQTIRIQTLKQYYLDLRSVKKITLRQYDLLMTLTKTLSPFAVSELYSNPIYTPLYRNVAQRTAQRDLKKLTDLKLLLKNENGAYELNLRALG